jgi:hypothetical protein
MENKSTSNTDPNAITLATWVYLLHDYGNTSDNGDVAAACETVSGSGGEEDGEQAGLALVQAVETVLADAQGEVDAAARLLFGERLGDAFHTGSRAERLGRIRKYQFTKQLPWLAYVWERKPENEVRPGWVIVEQVTDIVRVMDPNPWDELDEQRQISTGDFMVLWELGQCRCAVVS